MNNQSLSSGKTDAPPTPTPLPSDPATFLDDRELNQHLHLLPYLPRFAQYLCPTMKFHSPDCCWKAEIDPITQQNILTPKLVPEHMATLQQCHASLINM